MYGLAVLAFVAATSHAAQQPAPAAAESARSESTPMAVALTPDQKHFLDGLRTAMRGIAQLKDGVNRVNRSQAGHDAAVQRRAGRFLAGLCGSARAFLARGRPQMRLSAYEDSAGVKARRLTSQIDSLIAYTPACEQAAGATPVPVAADVTRRLKAYDAALREFRVAAGIPVRPDSSPAGRRQ